MASSKFGIPDDELSAIRRRDTSCVYCGRDMIYPFEPLRRSESATVEHLSPDPPFYYRDGMTADNIVICCGSCNSSRGAKQLQDWFGSPYCVERNISLESVAEPVEAYLLILEQEALS